MHEDKSRIFKDFNFKLIVLNSLLGKETSFSERLEEVIELASGCEEGINMEVLEFFQNVKLTEKDLESVTELVFDAGEDIYFLIYPEWDGEDDMFDVKYLDGIEKLKNLKDVEYISLASEKLIEEIKERGINVA